MKQFFKKGNSTDVIIGVILFMISFPFLLNMHHFVSGGMHSAVSPLSFPRFVMVLVVILSVVLVITGLFSKPVPTATDGKKDATAANPVNSLIYLGLLFLYLILLHFVGFMIATPIIMVCVAYILNGRNFKVLIPGFIAFSVGLYFVALKLMKIMLPLGIFFE